MLDPDLIQRKIKLILEDLDRLRPYKDTSFDKIADDFASHEDTFHALAELRIYDKAFAQRIARSAGLRNRLVHEYNDTDPAIIFASVADALKQYTHYCEAVLRFVEKK